MANSAQTTRARPDTIPIVTDIPNESPGLNYKDYADGIAAAIRGARVPRMTVGLFGPWGVGKSSLLKAIEHNFDRPSDSDFGVVVFNAWRYQREPSLILPLLSTVQDSLNKKGMQRAEWSRLAQRIGSTLRRFEVSFAGFGVGYERDPETRYNAPFEELKRLNDTEDQKKLIILIDDLDRCSPDTIVNVLETIHTLTDIDGFIFVLALDYNYLKEAVAEKYPRSDPHLFVEKLIQVPFHIPEIRLAEDSIEEIVGTWGDLTDWLDTEGHLKGTTREIAQIVLRSNPRQLKRLINVYLLTRFVSWDLTEGNETLLMTVLAFQIGEKDSYDRLVKAAKRLKATESQTDLGHQPELLLKDVTSIDGDSEREESQSYAALFSAEDPSKPELIEKAQRILDYCTSLLDPDGTLTVNAFLDIDRLTAPEKVDEEPSSLHEASSSNRDRDQFQTGFGNLSRAAADTFAEIQDFVESLEPSELANRHQLQVPSSVDLHAVRITTRATSQYLSAVASQGVGTGTTLVALWPMPRRNGVKLSAGKLPDPFLAQYVSEIRDVGGQHRYQLFIPAGDAEKISIAEEFIEAALTQALETGEVTRKASGRPPENSTSRDDDE